MPYKAHAEGVLNKKETQGTSKKTTRHQAIAGGRVAEHNNGKRGRAEPQSLKSYQNRVSEESPRQQNAKGESEYRAMLVA